MTESKKVLSAAIGGTIILLASVAYSQAAPPDGLGPWADTVVSSSQGLTKAGLPVPAIRSNPASALGVAENNTTEGNFFSLGFGGTITLGFDNGISSGAFVVEATNPGYPDEHAFVEISEDGVTYYPGGAITQDSAVSIPPEITCGKFVRITDQSDPNDFPDSTADAFDVDGVQAQGESCQPTTTPPPSGGSGGLDCTSTIVQSNSSNTTNNVRQRANTGGNQATGNTGNGGTNITTGNVTQTTNITNTGSSNSATGGCCCEGTTVITITNNGAGSNNQVNVGKSAQQAQQSALRAARRGIR